MTPDMPPLSAEFHAQVEPTYRAFAGRIGRACAVKLVLDHGTPDEVYHLARWAASYALDALNWRPLDG